MSIVNVFVNSRRAVMLTDESLYRPDGTIIDFQKKAFPIESWTGAISGRGNNWGYSTAAYLAEAFASFDAFVEMSGPMLERAHRAAIEKGELEGQTLIEVHAVGWSEGRDRAKAYVLRSPFPMGEDDEDRPAYKWRDLENGEDGQFYSTFTRREYWQLHRMGAMPDVDFTADTFDPIRHGIPLIEAQRRQKADPWTGLAAGLHVVGGQLWLTTVDRDGVQQDVLRSWADEIGQPIRPARLDESKLPRVAPVDCPSWSFERFERALKGGAVDPETLSPDLDKLARLEAAGPTEGLSRQQRRAAEKQARKAPAHV